LYRREGLVRLDAIFVDRLKGADVELFNRLMAARSTPPDRKTNADLMVDLAPYSGALRDRWCSGGAAEEITKATVANVRRFECRSRGQILDDLYCYRR
jgi:hypothetical protein